MATIRKRNEKYQVQIRRKGFAPVVRSFTLRGDAEEWARFMDSRADRGDLPAPVRILDRHTVRDLIVRYRDEVSTKKKSYDSERFILDAFLRQSIANHTLSNISSGDFSAYREKRLKVVKPGTVNREFAILKHVFDMAIKEWDMPLRENPFIKLSKLKVNNARIRRLEKIELEAICTAVSKGRNKFLLPLILFAVETGMRRGELLRLKWQDINFDNKTLFIPLAKNGHSRTIPLTGGAITVLRDLQLSKYHKSNYVFPLTANGTRLAWERLLKRAQIEDLHFHDLRHEAISRFFERGLSVPEVALISGHRDFRMLFRYTHLRAEAIAEKFHQPTKETLNESSPLSSVSA